MGNPPEKFANAFRLASELGLCGPNGNNITAHGGEEGDPSYIKNALNFLNARRIDHGVRCLEDDELITELIDKKVYLTVCPGSNDCL